MFAQTGRCGKRLHRHVAPGIETRMIPESQPNFAGQTLAQARRALATLFEAVSREPATLDARLLLEFATGLSHADMLRDGDDPLSADAARTLDDLAARRLAGEPTSRLIGRRPFCGLDIAVRPGVLDPREDTETLVRLAGELRSAASDVLDLGTGSGALLCALLDRYPEAIGVGVDRSPDACNAARENLVRNGLTKRGAIVRGDWTAALAGPFDLIVSNPPYIATGDMPALADEVRLHDPALALEGGPDGFAAYRAILADIRRIVSPGALLVFEIGAGMRDGLEALFAALGIRVLRIARDTGGHERAVAVEII